MSIAKFTTSFFGISLSTITFMGFFQSLFQIWNGDRDFITLVSAILITILLPITITVTSKGLSNFESFKNVVTLAYCVVISIMVCSSYVVSCQVMMESPDEFFGFLFQEKGFSKNGNLAPLAVITIMYILSCLLFIYFANRVSVKMRIVASGPILLLVGYIIFEYLARGEFRTLWETSRAAHQTGDALVAYLVLMTSLSLFLALWCILREPVHYPPTQKEEARDQEES